MKSDIEKLKNFRKNYQLSQAKLARELGVSTGLIAAIELGQRNITLKFNQKIINKYNESLLEDINCKNNLSNVVPIPFYSAKAAAGIGEALPDYPEKDVIYFDKRWLRNVVGINPNNASIIQAKGESMQSTPSQVNDINDNDLLMIDDSIKEVINNQIFVINLGNNDLVVKRVIKEWDGRVILKSNNPNFKDIVPSEEAIIVGKVVWNGSKENI